jgi:hypothetical protein
MTNKAPVLAEHHPYTVYTLKGIKYVPHYKNPSAYVGPGYPRSNRNWFTKEQLLAAGATESVQQLLQRTTTAARNWND